MLVLAFAESVQIMPDFALVVHVVLILVMIWVLNRTFYRPINKVISARVSGKGGQISEADRILQTVAEKEQFHSDELLKTRNEGYDLIERERSAAMEKRQQKVAEARAEIAAKKAEQLGELSEQTIIAQQEIEKAAKKLAEEISSNIIKAA